FSRTVKITCLPVLPQNYQLHAERGASRSITAKRNIVDALTKRMEQFLALLTTRDRVHDDAQVGHEEGSLQKVTTAWFI
ncbi:MAG: hypothetical protein VXZ53_26025, partial [Planctomycetota bacterium]|nr:hypothetical protein [Planctomycetota bacterium]